MKHRYSEMIKAKVDNMDLVWLVKSDEEWSESQNELPVPLYCLDYFLCHPRHVNEIIHLLNGGNVKCYHKSREHLIFDCAEIKSWKESHWYMNGDVVSSIKPE